MQQGGANTNSDPFVEFCVVIFILHGAPQDTARPLYCHNCDGIKMSKKTYFLPPNFLSYPAATASNPGKIKLGQLISDIDDPGHTIGTLLPLDLARHDIPNDSVKLEGMGHTASSSTSYHANLFLKAVEIVSGKFNITVSSSNKLLSIIEEIEAQSIDPKNSYVSASLQQSEVQSWLRASWGRRRVFMICGILIARPTESSKVDLSTGSTANFSGEAEATAAPAQVPIGAGGSGGRMFANEFGLQFIPKTPFIYGYEVRECFFKKGQGSSKAFHKGAKLHASREGPNNGVAAVEDPSFEYVAIAKTGLDFESLGDAGEGFEEITMESAGVEDQIALVVSKTK
jgi:hypothetical protein